MPLEREIIEEFNRSIEGVLYETADIGIKKVEAIPTTPDNLLNSGILVIIGLSGDKTGEVILELEKEVAGKIVAKFQNNLPGVKTDDIDTAVILEFYNLVIGRVITSLFENNGIEINISSPILIISDSLDIRTYRKESIQLKYETMEGDFSLLLSVTDTPNKSHSYDDFDDDDYLNF